MLKKQYYSKQFDLYKNDAKKTWDVLREIIHRNKKKAEFPTTFVKNGETITDKTKIANQFNEFFYRNRTRTSK